MQIKQKNLEQGAIAKLNNNTYITARNAANNGDINLLKVNASDKPEFAVLPQSAGTPSAANDLVTKSYADGLTGSGATTSLNNLTTTSINQNLLPSADVTRNLGSTSLRWNSAFIAGLNDASNVVSINVGSRVLVDSAGSDTLDYSNATNITSYKNVLPSADNTKNLGSAALRFAQAFIGLIKDATGVNIINLTSRLLVNAAGNTALDFSGTDISINTRKITNVVDPTSAQDAATKAYVDLVAVAQKPWYQDAITLSGTDITNQNCTLAQTPITASETVFFNGVFQRPVTDYTISGNTLSFAGDLATGGSSALVATDVLYVKYQY